MALNATVIKLAAQNIAKYGSAATLTYKAAGAYDPATSGATATTSTVSTHVIMEAYSDYLSQRNSSAEAAIDVTRIRSGDHKATMSAKDITTAPKPGDTLTVLSEVWRVVSVSTEYLEGVAVMYTLQVRK